MSNVSFLILLLGSLQRDDTTIAADFPPSSFNDSSSSYFLQNCSFIFTQSLSYAASTITGAPDSCTTGSTPSRATVAEAIPTTISPFSFLSTTQAHTNLRIFESPIDSNSLWPTRTVDSAGGKVSSWLSMIESIQLKSKSHTDLNAPGASIWIDDISQELSSTLSATSEIKPGDKTRSITDFQTNVVLLTAVQTLSEKEVKIDVTTSFAPDFVTSKEYYLRGFSSQGETVSLFALGPQISDARTSFREGFTPQLTTEVSLTTYSSPESYRTLSSLRYKNISDAVDTSTLSRRTIDVTYSEPTSSLIVSSFSTLVERSRAADFVTSSANIAGYIDASKSSVNNPPYSSFLSSIATSPPLEGQLSLSLTQDSSLTHNFDGSSASVGNNLELKSSIPSAVRDFYSAATLAGAVKPLSNVIENIGGSIAERSAFPSIASLLTAASSNSVESGQLKSSTSSTEQYSKLSFIRIVFSPSEILTSSPLQTLSIGSPLSRTSAVVVESLMLAESSKGSDAVFDLTAFASTSSYSFAHARYVSTYELAYSTAQQSVDNMQGKENATVAEFSRSSETSITRLESRFSLFNVIFTTYGSIIWTSALTVPGLGQSTQDWASQSSLITSTSLLTTDSISGSPHPSIRTMNLGFVSTLPVQGTSSLFFNSASVTSSIDQMWNASFSQLAMTTLVLASAVSSDTSTEPFSSYSKSDLLFLSRSFASSSLETEFRTSFSSVVSNFSPAAYETTQSIASLYFSQSVSTSSAAVTSPSQATIATFEARSASASSAVDPASSTPSLYSTFFSATPAVPTQIESASASPTMSSSLSYVVEGSILSPLPRIEAFDNFQKIILKGKLMTASFTKDLEDNSTQAFQLTSRRLRSEVEKVLTGNLQYEALIVKKFRNGSVQFEADLYYNANASAVSVDQVVSALNDPSKGLAIEGVTGVEVCTSGSCHGKAGICTPSANTIRCICNIGFEGDRCQNAYAVNGGYDFWQAWGACNQSCHNGTRMRIRTCSRPVPINGGLPCRNGTVDKEVSSCKPDGCDEEYVALGLLCGAIGLAILVLLLAFCVKKRHDIINDKQSPRNIKYIKHEVQTITKGRVSKEVSAEGDVIMDANPRPQSKDFVVLEVTDGKPLQGVDNPNFTADENLGIQDDEVVYVQQLRTFLDRAHDMHGEVKMAPRSRSQTPTSSRGGIEADNRSTGSIPLRTMSTRSSRNSSTH